MCVNRQAKIYHKIIETTWKITFILQSAENDASLKSVTNKRQKKNRSLLV